MKGYSTIDHIHVVNQVIEISGEFSKPLYMAFIDYEKEFGSVNTAAVLEALKDEGIKGTYIMLLDGTYKGCAGRIFVHKKSEKFPITKDAQIRDAISLQLFSAGL